MAVLFFCFTSTRNGAGRPFNATGHYPILVGYDNSENAVYLAWIPATGDFACITDDASTVTYVDHFGGDTHTTTEFCVLALRYDPCDVIPHPSRAINGALDPTGPLFWLQLWPEKDPDYDELENRSKNSILQFEDWRLVEFLDKWSKRPLDKSVINSHLTVKPTISH